MDGNISIEDLEQHLLFHKAMTENTDTYQRIGGYMDILAKTETGERLPDPVDEAIRSVFNLVLENGIDPWEIDLSEFVRLYNNKVVSTAFDMIVAGKLMYMAWKILRLQSESTRVMSEPPVFEEMGTDFDEFFMEDDVMVVPEVTLNEAYRREPVRPVTMLELIDAFEGARAEIEIQQERERVRAGLKAKEPLRFENKAHEEDDKRDVEEVWQRIQKMGAGQISISDMYTDDLKENLKVFLSVLHLVNVGYLDIWQDELPYGEIFIEMKSEAIDGRFDDSFGNRIEAVM